MVSVAWPQERKFSSYSGTPSQAGDDQAGGRRLVEAGGGRERVRQNQGHRPDQEDQGAEDPGGGSALSPVSGSGLIRNVFRLTNFHGS